MRSAHEAVQAIARATARDRALANAYHGRPTDGAADQFTTTLIDLVDALDRASLAYALIGGVAVGIIADTPCGSDDVDVAVATSVEREALRTTLAGFVFRGSSEHSLHFRHANGDPVQVTFDPAFDAIIERAQPHEIGGRPVRIVLREDLIAMKERAAADPARRKSKALRDLADVELLRGDVPLPDEGW